MPVTGPALGGGVRSHGLCTLPSTVRSRAQRSWARGSGTGYRRAALSSKSTPVEDQTVQVLDVAGVAAAQQRCEIVVDHATDGQCALGVAGASEAVQPGVVGLDPHDEVRAPLWCRQEGAYGGDAEPVAALLHPGGLGQREVRLMGCGHALPFQ
ncbi:hypothetical protein SMALB_1570 [Streptomyces malaysiensis]|uniref:Uncharacterized protein n=1 Tax=Streptomyces malaysiensis TaxID=92644 RepID=A0A7X5WZ11_STRMQ|nr:hypothetical protein [Streptomyces malaysiensis]